MANAIPANRPLVVEAPEAKPKPKKLGPSPAVSTEIPQDKTSKVKLRTVLADGTLIEDF